MLAVISVPFLVSVPLPETKSGLGSDREIRIEIPGAV